MASAGAPQSASELEARLQGHIANLSKIEMALRSDPLNADLLKLKAQLLQLIQITSEMVRAHVLARCERAARHDALCGAPSFVDDWLSVLSEWLM